MKKNKPIIIDLNAEFRTLLRWTLIAEILTAVIICPVLLWESYRDRAVFPALIAAFLAVVCAREIKRDITTLRGKK